MYSKRTTILYNNILLTLIVPTMYSSFFRVFVCYCNYNYNEK